MGARAMAKLILSFKGRLIASHPVEDRPLCIGRDKGCDIKIDSLAIAYRHAVITPHQDGYVIAALSPTYPIALNNERVARAYLHDGDLIRIGKHSLQFREAAQETAIRPPPSRKPAVWEIESELAYVQIQSGPDLGRVIPLERDQTRLSQAGSQALVIARRAEGHVVFCEHPAVEITVNGTPAPPSTESALSDGAVIQAGALRCQFFCRGWTPG